MINVLKGGYSVSSDQIKLGLSLIDKSKADVKFEKYLFNEEGWVEGPILDMDIDLGGKVTAEVLKPVVIDKITVNSGRVEGEIKFLCKARTEPDTPPEVLKLTGSAKGGLKFSLDGKEHEIRAVVELNSEKAIAVVTVVLDGKAIMLKEEISLLPPDGSDLTPMP